MTSLMKALTTVAPRPSHRKLAAASRLAAALALSGAAFSPCSNGDDRQAARLLPPSDFTSPAQTRPAPRVALPPETVLLVKANAAEPVNSTSSFENKVSFSVEGDWRVIKANGVPDHAPGQFPNRGNPNRISPQNHTFRVPVNPKVADRPTSSNGGWFGVALNGVPFEPGTAEFWSRDWKYEAIGGSMNLGLDDHLAHVQPTGAYHYHGPPTGLIAKLGGDGQKMLLIGWAADGFPIYSANGHTDAKDAKSPLKKMRPSYQLRQGNRPGQPNGPGGKYDGAFTEDYEFVKGSGDLDECNGRYGATPEFPQGTYHYHVTAEFPFLSRLWRGTPDASFQKGGPGGPGGRRGGPGFPGGPFDPKGPPPKKGKGF
jgi:hypothetical protein